MSPELSVGRGMCCCSAPDRHLTPLSSRPPPRLPCKPPIRSTGMEWIGLVWVDQALPSHAWWRDFVSGGEEHVLVWERGPLTELHAAMRDLAWKKASRR